MALAKGLWLESLRTGQDLVFLHHALESGRRTGSPGLSASAWSKIRFLEAPVCHGCGTPYGSHEDRQSLPPDCRRRV
jgi:hypothetical protein